ncbi:MAG: HAD family hydrolase [Deltaproteobacteria bacterium]|nr:HAD family hydrolase [Deltaproteobacteria bacterium]MBW1983232.1 HAD family hydrolase [Deltaproteobacteria bacterium]
MNKDDIPYKDIKTIFIDAGNTLISMDFSWVLRELEPFGLTCTVEQLQRAEAASRPVVSKELERLKSTESDDTFAFYVKATIEHLPKETLPKHDNIDSILTSILPVLRAPGQTMRLWSYILPGVPKALSILNEKGFQLAVVSNSDGSVEKGLSDLGLSQHFHAIIDSQVIGYEKPDPRIFEHALAICNADPDRTVHIGDMYDTDILGAKAAGIHSILLDPYNDWNITDCPKQPDLLNFAMFIAAKIGR